MKITLQSIQQQDDITICDKWAKDIESEQYQSRYYPNLYLDKKIINDDNLLFWRYIFVGETKVGTIWLEKMHKEDDVAILGIMIGNESYFGKNIGREAINLAIIQAKPFLGIKSIKLNVRKLNKRAISCYHNCGFEIIHEDRTFGKNGINMPYYIMKIDLN